MSLCGTMEAMWNSKTRTVATSVLLGLSIAVVASCSQDDSGTPGEVTEVTISEMASPTDPVVSAPPTTIIDRDVPEAGLPEAEVVNIMVDVSEGVTQEESVPLGTPVTIRVRSSVEDEFHLHGYDLELKGTDVLFTFTADRIGEFILEGHNSGQEVLILRVVQG